MVIYHSLNCGEASATVILAPQEDNDFIDVDDIYEPSTDDLNIGDQPYLPPKARTRQSNGHVLKPREKILVAPDGPSTTRLKQGMQPINVDSDPIEQFESSEFVPSNNSVSVKERVAHFNQVAMEPRLTGPHLDLRRVNKPRTIKDKMRPREQQVRLAYFPLLSS